MRYHVVVVGGGLSGLVATRALAAGGVRVTLVEARDRLGGRILSTAEGTDLGPAWLWPSVNPRLSALVADLGLEMFRQHERGAGIYEAPSGRVRIPTYAQGSMRLVGGMAGLIDALVGRLEPVELLRSTRLGRLERTDAGVALHLESTDAVAGMAGVSVRLDADAVVLAAPPRVLADTVMFEPALPDETSARWASTPTWMAGHAKFVARYESPFWREHGWSGMASSQVGPMGEIHDASPHAGRDGGAGALFGFLGVPALRRRALGSEALIAACVAQLERIFGKAAASPVSTGYMDWADEPYTARRADRDGFGDHPHPQPAVLPEPWASCVMLAGSEFSSTVPGYLEGAVQAAEAAAARCAAALGD